MKKLYLLIAAICATNGNIFAKPTADLQAQIHASYQQQACAELDVAMRTNNYGPIYDTMNAWMKTFRDSDQTTRRARIYYASLLEIHSVFKASFQDAIDREVSEDTTEINRRHMLALGIEISNLAAKINN